MYTEDFFTQGQILTLNILVGVELGIYVVLILFMTCICYQFLIKHKFYKERHLLHFYIQAFSLVIFRIAQLGILLSVKLIDAKNIDRIETDFFSTLACYSRVLIGITEADKRLSISMELFLINKDKKENTRIT